MRLSRILLVICFINVSFAQKKQWAPCCPDSHTKFSFGPGLRKGFNFVGQAIKDAFLLNINLISTESFIVIASTLPFYLASRLVDDNLQCHFFSHNGHKNIIRCPVGVMN